jgi:hypothetical protein
MPQQVAAASLDPHLLEGLFGSLDSSNIGYLLWVNNTEFIFEHFVSVQLLTKYFLFFICTICLACNSIRYCSLLYME